MSLGLILSAFFAGLLMFLAPCTLPLVPGYLAFISGASIDEIKGNKKEVRKKVILNGLLFVLGFTFIFILFGVLAGFVGTIIGPIRVWLTRIGGLIVIFFGLSMLGLFKLSIFEKTLKIGGTEKLKRGKLVTSFALGASFAVGWTPCVGPILGGILLLASQSTTVLQGGLLLFVFSLGLSLPFMIVAFGASYALGVLKKVQKYMRWFEIVGGIFVVLLGILLLFDRFGLLISYGYQLFEFVNYEALLDYL